MVREVHVGDGGFGGDDGSLGRSLVAGVGGRVQFGDGGHLV